MRLRAFPTFLALGGVVLAACATYDSSLLVDGSGGSAGVGGGGGSSAGTGGSAGGGTGGDAGTGGTAGASGAGAAGKGGSAGTGGTGGAGASGKGGASGAGTGGTAGASGAGTGGTAGSGGASGTAGTGGASGTSGTAGNAGTSGSAGNAGTAGSAGTGGGGAAGTAGSAGSGGAKTCSGAAECDDTNPCTTDTCEAMACKHVNLADDTATPGAVNDPKDCKKNVCKAGKDTAVADTTEVPDDANECTTDTCGADGKPLNAKLTGPTCGGGTKHCSVGVCVSNTCGDGVIGDAEECDKADFGPKSCLDYGFGSPSGLKCTAGCTIDSAGCAAVCGNSKLEGIEECDDDTSKGAPGDGCSKYCMKEPAVGDLVITEILFNPEKSQVGSVETGEWFEIYNASTTAYDLRGLQVGGNGSENFLIDDVKPLVLQPGAYAVLAKNGDPTQNGGVTSVLFVYGTAMALSNSSDSIEIRVPSTPLLVIDRIDYTDGASVGYKGASKELSRTHLNAVDNNGTTSTNWCPATTPFGLGDLGTPGAENGCP